MPSCTNTANGKLASVMSQSPHDGASRSRRYKERINDLVANSHISYGRDFQPLSQFLEAAPEAGTGPRHDQYVLVGGRDEQPRTVQGSYLYGHLLDCKQQDEHLVLFVHGFPDARGVEEIGAAYEVEPDSWRQHLSFLSHFPSLRTFEDVNLPSAQNDVIQIPIWSVGTCDLSRAGRLDGVESMRKRAAQSMSQYFQRLDVALNWKPGDSIVRQHVVINERLFALQQMVTVSVSRHVDLHSARQRSFVLVCADFGADLQDSPRGPWFHDANSPTSPFYTHILPIPEHSTAPSGSLINPGSLHAQVCSLFRHCTDAIDKDPFFALSGVLSLFTSSHAQFLQVIADEIGANARPLSESSMAKNLPSISNLMYMQSVLEERINDLQNVARFVRDRNLSTWAQPKASSLQVPAEAIIQDIGYLLERSRNLRDRIERVMTTSMSVASVEQAKRGTLQNENIFKFTVLASCYVPLSYAASLFGMNLEVLGQGSLSLKWYFAVSLPIFISSVLFLFADKLVLLTAWQALKNFMARAP